MVVVALPLPLPEHVARAQAVLVGMLVREALAVVRGACERE